MYSFFAILRPIADQKFRRNDKIDLASKIVPVEQFDVGSLPCSLDRRTVSLAVIFVMICPGFSCDKIYELSTFLNEEYYVEKLGGRSRTGDSGSQAIS